MYNIISVHLPSKSIYRNYLDTQIFENQKSNKSKHITGTHVANSHLPETRLSFDKKMKDQNIYNAC